jgi:hypothetical protein
VGIGPSAQQRLALVIATMLGEEESVSLDVAAFFDLYLKRVPKLTAFGLRLVVWALVWLPLLFIGMPLPASELSTERRVRYLGKWAGSNVYWIREGFFLVKAVALMGWGGHPVVRERLGVPPVAATREAA